MKSVQKFGSLLLAVLMILSLAACGSKASNDTPAQTPSNGTPSESTPSETPDDATAGDSDNTAFGGKVLVVYYRRPSTSTARKTPSTVSSSNSMT